MSSWILLCSLGSHLCKGNVQLNIIVLKLVPMILQHLWAVACYLPTGTVNGHSFIVTSKYLSFIIITISLYTMSTVRQALSRSACGHNKSYQRSAHHYLSRCTGIYLHIQFFSSASSSITPGHSHFTSDGLYRHRWLQPPLLCWQGFEPETTAQFRYHSTSPSSKELFRNNDTNNVTTPTDILINLRPS